MTHKSFCEFHLGDSLIHLHFLRALAKRHPDDVFTHRVHPCHIPQLQDVVADLPNLNLESLGTRETHPSSNNGYNAWKNAGAGLPGGGYWENHPARHRHVEFHLKWFAHLAKNMGLESPFTQPADLLFDYPAILSSHRGNEVDPPPHVGGYGNFDILIVNSQPCSGQFRAYDALDCMDELVRDLAARGHRAITTKPVRCDTSPSIPLPGRGGEGGPSTLNSQPSTHFPCTLDWNLTLTEIGTLSLRLPHLVMVATGPMWATFNVWNRATVQTRLLLLDCGEDLTALCPGTVQTATLAGAREILKGKGLL